jgi:hypothetical protein
VFEKPKKPQPLPATDSAPRPGDFPVGSPESRAAARLMLRQRSTESQRIEIITSIQRPAREWSDWTDKTKPYATPWSETTDGRLMRMLYVPSGMTAYEARRIVDGEGEQRT